MQRRVTRFAPCQDGRQLTNHRELMRLHVEALFVHDAEGRLVRGNEPSGAPAPRFFVGRTVAGCVIRYRHDVDSRLTAAMQDALADEDPREYDLDSPPDMSRYEAILARAAPVQRTWAGPVFCFPPELRATTDVIRVTEENAQLLQPHLEDWLPDVHPDRPMFAVMVDGHAAAVCCSVRETSMAHEAGVDTAPAFRGRGYAGRVVTAWARAVRDAGLVPLYSTSWQNGASRAVARKLGLIPFGSDFHIT